MNMPALIKVWDLPLRIFHWLLVLGFTVAYLTEDELLDIHVWAGYLVFALLAFRLVWGFIGSPYARFSQFLCSPLASIAYIKDLLAAKAKRYLGHNPAGAAMIVLLLLSLLATTLSGFAVYGADQGAGPLAGIGSDNEELWEEIHEFFANFSVVLIVLHIAGVILESVIHKENLAKAMIQGSKKSLDDKL
ncbi:cytochrome b/b6 domain-containing protein [Methylovulum psychrotolerans]|uniref:Cytochrome b n=1 Tax=Methylovulum psychrotolerans TaxID=1704499 RepID=A0A2S5CHN5_9GAMM|nr:cytochrome b/b6 domain-containing protein [Methylovulum psychrotolerans]POZ50242.1 cytochrome b [Methylovulum psychrotolerans]